MEAEALAALALALAALLWQERSHRAERRDILAAFESERRVLQNRIAAPGLIVPPVDPEYAPAPPPEPDEFDLVGTIDNGPDEDVG